MEDFKKNLEVIEENICNACKKAGRSRDEVTLIAVSKTKPVEDLQAVYDLNIRDFGENKVQELKDKIEVMPEDIKWHMIGHLQRNKVKYIIGKTSLIHSVNTVELAEEISKRSESNNVTTSVLLQANVSGEESKHGFAPHELKPAIDKIMALPSIKVCGLMTMAPIEEYEGQAREVFAKTRVIFEDLKSYTGLECFNVLSMGMSDSYECAIEEGSTLVRVGSAIFGARHYQ